MVLDLNISFVKSLYQSTFPLPRKVGYVRQNYNRRHFVFCCDFPTRVVFCLRFRSHSFSPSPLCPIAPLFVAEKHVSIRSGLRTRKRDDSPEPREPTLTELWLPEEALELWEIRQFADKVNKVVSSNPVRFCRRSDLLEIFIESILSVLLMINDCLRIRVSFNLNFLLIAILPASISRSPLRRRSHRRRHRAPLVRHQRHPSSSSLPPPPSFPSPSHPKSPKSSSRCNFGSKGPPCNSKGSTKKVGLLLSCRSLHWSDCFCLRRNKFRLGL